MGAAWGIGWILTRRMRVEALLSAVSARGMQPLVARAFRCIYCFLVFVPHAFAAVRSTHSFHCPSPATSRASRRDRSRARVECD